jgi:AAA+ superfamily predicted ATPase
MQDGLDLMHLTDVQTWFTAFLRLRGMSDQTGADAMARVMIKARIRMQDRSREHPALHARVLAERLGLSESELQLVQLLAVVATMTDVKIAMDSVGVETSLDNLRDLVHGRQPSRVALAELGPRGSLRRLGLIERSDGGGPEVHESRQTWAIARRVLAWLHGDDSIDPELDGIARIADATPIEEIIVAGDALAQTREAVRAKDAIVVATGKPGFGRRTLLGAVAHEANVAVLEVDARRVTSWKVIARECRLLGRAPLLRDADDQLEAIGRELVPEIAGPILVTTQGARPRWARPAIAIELSAPSSAQRARLWRAALPAASEADAEYLAGQYPLAPALVHHAARAIHARAGERALRPEDVTAGIRGVLDDRLGEYARRIDVTQSWDDLVLPHDQIEAVLDLCARIRQRRTVYEQWGFAAKVGKGLGVAALFSGPPGTGKTMVAGLVAKELGLELYQVDMAKITSKFIGETEKHLGALFDAAEAAHAILLFDEADALFGKRTDVRSSNDRYANLETNYLLQRMESFTGICLLTSNHESHLDPAFQRRLAVHVRFELPDDTERARLWRAMLPAAAPVAPGVDFGALARRFALAGGHIRNAALRAAFVAADEGSVISPAHLERAARLEIEAMGKIAA